MIEITITTETTCEICRNIHETCKVYTDPDEASNEYIDALPEGWIRDIKTDKTWCETCYDKHIRKPGEIWIA